MRFFELFYDGFNYIIGLGAAVMLPILITIIGLVVRSGSRKYLKAGITVGSGFIGIQLVVGILGDHVGPASQQMVERFGIQLDVLDVGWGAIAGVTWASPIIIWIILTIFLMNMLMLVFNKTDTLDVDIWNYHHVAIVGALIYFVTNNVWWSLFAVALDSFFLFKMADWTSKPVEEYFGMEGVSLPTMAFLSSAIIAIPFGWIYDRIPGLNKINITLDEADKYLGIFAEPSILGFGMGVIIGLLAGYDVGEILILSIHMAAVMIIIPKMTAMFVEGLMPISDAVNKFTQERFEGRKFLIGVDAAVVVGDETVITATLVLIPLAILSAPLLPGNRMLPFSDLAAISFRVALLVALFKGNLLKTIIVGYFVVISMLYAGTFSSEVLTSYASSTGFEFGTNIATFSATGLVATFTFVMTFISQYWYITVPALVIALAALYLIMEPKYTAWKEAKGF